MKAATIGREVFWEAVNRSTGRRQPCRLLKIVRRNGNFQKMNIKIYNRLLREHVDIIGGHIPLGVGERVWPGHNTSSCSVMMNETNENRRYRDVRYVAFFRNALQKYISGVSYQTRTRGGAAAKIRLAMNSSWVQGSHHSKYSAYLITPEQRQMYEQFNMDISKDGETVQIMANLIHFDVSVGITERLSHSMEILEDLFDANKGINGLFARYGGELLQKNKSNSSEVRLNPSRVSSSEMWSNLKNESYLTMKLLEFVKYEQQITDFALALHMRQHRSFLSN